METLKIELDPEITELRDKVLEKYTEKEDPFSDDLFEEINT